MATFRVRLQRDQTESADVFVEAPSKEEAFDIAVKKAGRYGELLPAVGWEQNDGNDSEVYLGDDRDIEEDAEEDAEE
jgi:hypothetical protein